MPRRRPVTACAASSAGLRRGAGQPLPRRAGPGCDEVWQIGLRNPFRFSFDRSNGDIFIGDVGQGTREEIDFRPFGAAGVANWGWRCYEGNDAYNPTGCGPIGNYDFPIHDYSHASGRCSVTGGYRYRGSVYPEPLRRLPLRRLLHRRDLEPDPGGGGAWTVAGPHYNASFSISSFGEDAAGELYVVAYSTGNDLPRARDQRHADADRTIPDVDDATAPTRTLHADAHIAPNRSAGCSGSAATR